MFMVTKQTVGLLSIVLSVLEIIFENPWRYWHFEPKILWFLFIFLHSSSGKQRDNAIRMLLEFSILEFLFEHVWNYCQSSLNFLLD